MDGTVSDPFSLKSPSAASFDFIVAPFWCSAGRVPPGDHYRIGLAISRAIVRLHDGRTWAERLPVGGTAFRFTLPIEALPAMPEEAAAPST